MTRNLPLHGAAVALSWLVPRAMRESFIGDLVEGYAHRRNATSGASALRWYLRQIGGSVAPLFWSALRSAAWPRTLGVAMLAYLAVGVAQGLIHWATTGLAHYSPVALVIVFPVVVLIAHAAERARRGAAFVLAAAMLLAITAMTLFTVEAAPLWYRAAYFVVGPAAALLGRTCAAQSTSSA